MKEFSQYITEATIYKQEDVSKFEKAVDSVIKKHKLELHIGHNSLSNIHVASGKGISQSVIKELENELSKFGFKFKGEEYGQLKFSLTKRKQLEEFFNNNISNNVKVNAMGKREIWTEYITKNRQDIIKGLSKYYGNIKNITFRSTFSSKDTDGNPISGAWVSYSTTDGRFNQDAYISDDGYIVNVSKIMTRGVPSKAEYSKNKYYHILPGLNNK